MMGSTEDPADGGKVAVAVFGAVGVYGVSDIQQLAACYLWGGVKGLLDLGDCGYIG